MSLYIGEDKITPVIESKASLAEYFTSDVKSGTSYVPGICNMIKKIPEDMTVTSTSLAYSFSSLSNITSIPSLNTANVTNMQYMFSGCSSLTTIPLLNTENVTNMDRMFESCTSLTSIPLLNTSNVTSMVSMFSGCLYLADLPLLNTGKLTNMNMAFNSCSQLTNESLNNILAMCTGVASGYNVNNKTLLRIGLTSEQATRCQSLSNYDAFIAAGWTTGY